jgi:hypothetical protein
MDAGVTVSVSVVASSSASVVASSELPAALVLAFVLVVPAFVLVEPAALVVLVADVAMELAVAAARAFSVSAAPRTILAVTGAGQRPGAGTAPGSWPCGWWIPRGRSLPR